MRGRLDAIADGCIHAAEDLHPDPRRPGIFEGVVQTHDNVDQDSRNPRRYSEPRAQQRSKQSR